MPKQSTEKARESRRRWRQNNPEKDKARRLQSYHRNSVEILKRKKIARKHYKKPNPEKIREKNRLYRMLHKEEIRLYDRTRYKIKPDGYIHKSSRYRARKNNCGGSHTVKEWQEKKQLYGNRCFYCGRKMKRLTQDHLVPVSRGGSDDISNIVPACQSCNSSKHTTMLEEFLLKKVSGQINFLF